MTSLDSNIHRYKFFSSAVVYNKKSKLCKFCSKPIIFKQFEIFTIIHPQDIFRWRRVVIKSWWTAMDSESGNYHTHDNDNNRYGDLSPGVAA